MGRTYLRVAETDRFFLESTIVERDNGLSREHITLWPKKDIPRPVASITLFGNFVEWMTVCDCYRRQGVATEMVYAVETLYGQLEFNGVTETGKLFENSYKEKYHD